MIADKRINIAPALFALMYEADTKDDPGYAARLWNELDQKQKAPWYRQADVAIAGGA